MRLNLKSRPRCHAYLFRRYMSNSFQEQLISHHCSGHNHLNLRSKWWALFRVGLNFARFQNKCHGSIVAVRTKNVRLSSCWTNTNIVRILIWTIFSLSGFNADDDIIRGASPACIHYNRNRNGFSVLGERTSPSHDRLCNNNDNTTSHYCAVDVLRRRDRVPNNGKVGRLVGLPARRLPDHPILHASQKFLFALQVLQPFSLLYFNSGISCVPVWGTRGRAEFTGIGLAARR